MNPEMLVVRFLIYGMTTLCAFGMFGAWCFAFVRTRLWPIVLLALSALLNVYFGLTSLLIMWKKAAVISFLGREGYYVFYNGLLCAQVIGAGIELVGTVLLVVWLCRTNHSSKNSAM